jgi:helitron helicase-like protein
MHSIACESPMSAIFPFFSLSRLSTDLAFPYFKIPISVHATFIESEFLEQIYPKLALRNAHANLDIVGVVNRAVEKRRLPPLFHPYVDLCWKGLDRSEVRPLRRLLYTEPLRTVDRPDLVSRVFKAKLYRLLQELHQNNIFGAYVVSVIEFQKRGLPHVQILLLLDYQDQLDTPGSVGDHALSIR